MKENLPVLLLKKLSLIPLQEVRLELNNELSKKIIDLSTKSYGKKILIILPLNSLETSPSVKDLPVVGVLTKIISNVQLPNGNYRVVVKGLNRVQILNYTTFKEDKSILISNVKRLYIDNGDDTEKIALKRKLIELTKIYIKLNPAVSNSILPKISDKESLDNLSDLIVNFINLPNSKKTIYMNEFNEVKRARNLIKELNIELEVIKLNNKLEQDIRIDFENEQKEYLLKAKIDKLNEELGLSGSKETEIATYYEKINNLELTESIKNKLVSELKKYEYTPFNNPDSSIIRNYLDTVLSLPFNLSSKEELNRKKVRGALDKTHYGNDYIKNRIEEYVALKEIENNLESPIICFVGPPGVGKTTLAMSISDALKREFIKISVGGLNDSSELIGHRRTYLGASSGKIISGIKKVGVNNPVILIDEVDKMVKDFKGDPASVLLDILDVNQNKNFTDNYIEEPFDLSKVLFILTANDEGLIPAPLKDRLEIINLESYTIYDKKDIASSYLIPKIFIKYNSKRMKIKEELILYIINNYTLESGVRELERVLDKLIRNIIINKITVSKITIKYITEVLGNNLYEQKLKLNDIGTTKLVGITPLGGQIVSISTIYVPDEDNLIITGNIGESLKDNIKVIISYLKSSKYLDNKILSKQNMHINFESNFKLDGYSGGVGIATSILSLINKKKIDDDITFLGKLDLHGNVLKVTGVKEKIISAYNNGIKTIYLPKDNINNTKDIPEFILNEINLIFISNYKEAYKKLF